MSIAFRPSVVSRSLVLVAALLAASASSQATNLFVNPGFETGDFTGWTDGGGAFVTNIEAHTGQFAFSGFAGGNVVQTFIPVATSSISELSFWGKRSGGLFDAIELIYSDNSTELVLVNMIGGGDDWTFINITGDLDAGKLLTSFQIFGTSPGPAFLDDFNLQVAAAPEPASLALLGLGLAGLGFSRRRKLN